jgi:predicted acyl esterase
MAGSWRFRGLVLALAVACTLGFTSSSAAAPQPITSFFNQDASGSCPRYGDQEICSGQVPSFDGSKLDVDLTKPASGTGTSHPLMLMFHGFGNNKHEWESLTDEGDGADKYHWNSHWFAKHGYYVLTYTARGFRDDGPGAAYRPNTPSFTSVDLPSGTLHLKSREFEVKDSQYLGALVADAFADVDRDRVAVSGGSYGGGESWLQASQRTWSFPDLPTLQLQVSVPKYPWTDLAYALAPNGHGGGPSKTDIYESSQGEEASDTGEGNPIGVLKASNVAGLTALGQRQGVFEEGTTTTPSQEGPINIPAWTARAAAGDPYDNAGVEEPLVQQIRRGLTEFRGPYYQDEGFDQQRTGRKVAVFSIQGWTDDLFEAVESFRQFKYLKRLDPRWPVAVALGDVGHSRAQNKPATWLRINAQAFQFLQANINGSHDQETTVSSEPTICANDSDQASNDTAAQRFTATTPERLSNGRLTIRYQRGDTTTSGGGVGDPNGPATDPVVGGVFNSVIGSNGACRTSPGNAPATGGYTAFSDPLPSQATYVGLGSVRVPYTLIGGTTATLNARVWDVVPGGGPTVLMTRGTYRIDTPAYDGTTGALTLPLFGNHWPLAPGHKVRLDLTQVDQPYLRESNVASSIRFDPPTLTLPTREAGERILSGN